MLGMALNATMVVWQMDEALVMATPTCASEGSYTIHLILQGQHYEALLSRALAVECVSAEDCVPMTPFHTTDCVEQVKQAHAAARAKLERHRAQLNVQQTWDKPPPRDGNPTAELELTEEDVQPTGFLNVDVEVQTALFNSFTPLTGTEAPRTKPVKVQQKTDQGFLGSGGTQLAGASTTTVSSLKATQGSMPWSKQMSSQKSTAQSRTRGGLRGVVSQRGGFIQGPGRSSVTPAFERAISTKTLNKLRKLDPEAVVWLRATLHAANSGVVGRLTVAGLPEQLTEVAEHLYAHCQCRLALLCAKREKLFYDIDTGSKRCIESERAALRQHNRQLWEAPKVLEYVQQHGDAHQLFAPGDADSIAS